MPALPALPAGLGFSLLAYLLSRVPVVASIAVFLARNPSRTLGDLLTYADGWWYVHLAQAGYSASLHPALQPATDFRHRYSDWAFFPGYPMAVRGVHAVTGLPYLAAACVAAAVFGLLAVWAVHALAAAFGGAGAGRSAALLFAFWPGSAALSLPYSEGLFLAAAAACLLALHRSRWVLAGLLGAVATGTRPTGLALVAAAGVVAAVRLVRGRDPRALVAPVLATGGAAAFVAYGWLRAGDPMVWRHAENLWGQHLDFSARLLQTWTHVLSDPGATLADDHQHPQFADTVWDLTGLLLIVLMLVAAVAVRRRVTAPMASYALVTIGLIVGYSAVAPRPRTVLAVVPGFVWLALWLPRRLVAVVCVLIGTAGLAVITYLWVGLITP